MFWELFFVVLGFFIGINVRVLFVVGFFVVNFLEFFLGGLVIMMIVFGVFECLEVGSFWGFFLGC